MRLTPNGRLIAVAAVVLLVAGLVAGYSTLVGVAVALGAALAIAVILVSRPTTIHTERRIVPERVVAGGEAFSVLTVTNTAARRSGAGTVRERIADQHVPVELPSLDPGESAVLRRRLPTDDRGIFPVGPLTIRRGDPLGLLLRGADEDDRSRLIVHPATHTVNPFPSGVNRDLDGTPSGESSDSGIAFSGLREYVPGDDLRLIHWRSSARVGELMVRYNVDNQQPRTAVILDTRAGLHDRQSFEDAIRAAASVVMAAMSRRFPFTVRTTCGQLADDRMSKTAVMDMFSGLEPDTTGEADLGTLGLRAAQDPSGLSLACITGRASVDDLRGLGPLRARYEQLTIVRVGTGAQAGVFELAGAVLINAPDSHDFARAWNRRIRRR
jgi:uncharacterized protein (DUF58 family)